MTCTCQSSVQTALSARAFTSFSLPSGGAPMGAMAAAVAAGQLIVTHHVSAMGDLLVSTQNPNAGTVDIKGNLGFVEVDLTIGIKSDGASVTVSIEVREPLKLGPAEWMFDITGKTLTRRTAPSTAGLMAASFDWSCILKCGGEQIMPILIQCLPSLIGGPKAFVSCVIAQLAGNSSEIAKCIATSCL